MTTDTEQAQFALMEPDDYTSVAITRAAAPTFPGLPTRMTSHRTRSTGTCSPPTRPRPSGLTSTRGSTGCARRTAYRRR
jgi:hypothetical protein